MRDNGKFVVLAAALLALVLPALRAEDKAAASGSATEVGASTCAGCHAEQVEEFKKAGHAVKLKAVKKIDFEKSCESCHGPGSLHAEAAGDRSSPGFGTIKKPGELPASEASAACLSCHKSGKHLMLWGTSIHKAGGVSCVKCHSVHKGEGKAQLVKDGVETCLECHKKVRGQIQLASHHPLIEGKLTCAGCHNPHGGVEGNILESVEETCFKCHADKAGPFAEFEHAPAVEGCDVCHKPHGSANDMLLKQPLPFLCFTCHKNPHVDNSTTAGRIAIGVKTLQQRGRCTMCHRDIHGSDRHGQGRR